MGEFYVYILFSPSTSQTYVGQTNNLTDRIWRHNKGIVRSTKRYMPWKCIYTERYGSRSEAVKREMYLKTGAGRRAVAEIVKRSL